MKPLSTMVWCLGTAGVVLSLPQPGWAETKPNPYLSIVDRNPFGLKDPPPPAPAEVEKPATPPAKVILTGITSLFGPDSKRCFLEITEQEPGKPANILKPILREGEQSGSVEVVSIDVEKNIVKIKNSGQELDLKFEDPSKLASAAPRPVVPGMPAPPAPAFHPPATVSAGAPTIISPASADNSTRNSSVSMFGGQAHPVANAPAPAVNSMGGAPGYNGANPSALGAINGANRIIPSRPLRTQSQEGSPDPAVQYATTLLQTKHYENKGIPMPPMPPMPGEPSPNTPAFPPTPGGQQTFP